MTRAETVAQAEQLLGRYLRHKPACSYREAIGGQAWCACSCGLQEALVALLREHDQGWRDIESAPKDGTTLIGFDASREYEPEEGLGAVEFMRFLDGSWLDPCTHTMKPTHWMPLPPPPGGSQR